MAFLIWQNLKAKDENDRIPDAEMCPVFFVPVHLSENIFKISLRVFNVSLSGLWGRIGHAILCADG